MSISTILSARGHVFEPRDHFCSKIDNVGFFLFFVGARQFVGEGLSRVNKPGTGYLSC